MLLNTIGSQIWEFTPIIYFAHKPLSLPRGRPWEGRQQSHLENELSDQEN